MLKKYTLQLDIKKIAKTALAMVLVASFTLSSTQAFASETTTENNNQLEVVELQTEAKAVEQPTLVPGDFFYFAKLTIEKIKLILTLNDVKEAELLAKFASERLAEAEVLFAEGKEDRALETIKKALEDMNSANNVVVEQTEDKDATVTDKVETEVDKNDSPSTTDVTVNTDVQVQVTTDVAAPTTTETPVTSETSVPTVEAPSNDLEVVKDIEGIITQNIIALTAAMEKVQNPVAKAALQKNIDKSYEKLAKKLAKIEARLAKEADQEAEVTVDAEVKLDVEVDKEEVEADDKLEASNLIPVVVPAVKDVKVKEVKEKKKAHKDFKSEAKKRNKEFNKEKRENREKVKKEKHKHDQKKDLKGNKGNSQKREHDRK